MQGRGDDAERVLADARAVAEAGAFAVVLEKVAEAARPRDHRRRSPFPPSASAPRAACDGQILVVDDMLGLFADFRPKFVKRYAELGSSRRGRIAAYAEDVRERRFPGRRAHLRR